MQTSERCELLIQHVKHHHVSSLWSRIITYFSPSPLPPKQVSAQTGAATLCPNYRSLCVVCRHPVERAGASLCTVYDLYAHGATYVRRGLQRWRTCARGPDLFERGRAAAATRFASVAVAWPPPKEAGLQWPATGQTRCLVPSMTLPLPLWVYQAQRGGPKAR